MPSQEQLTPAEQLIMDVLQDGQSRTKDELRLVVGDEFTSDDSIRKHMVNLRRKLEPQGFSIQSRESPPPTRYRMVRLIDHDE